MKKSKPSTRSSGRRRLERNPLLRLVSPQDILTEKARRRLRAFIEQAWHILEPATPFVAGWHIDAISEHLEAVSAGQILNLIVNIPPRFMKSLSGCVFWPAWDWASRPWRRWLFGSYALSLSIRDSVRCRSLIESTWYQERWGHAYQLSGDQNLKTRFDNDKRGFRFSGSVGGGLTGEGGDIIVIDDPHDILEAQSEIARQTVCDWWDSVVSSRRNDPKTSARVIIMQRLHRKDLVGHVLEKEKDFVHLRLPAEYDGKRTVTVLGPEKTWSDPRTKEGDILWPARFGREEFAKLKTTAGPYGWAGQYQQEPRPAGGALFKAEWFSGRMYRMSDDGTLIERPGKPPVPWKNTIVFGIADLAASLKKQADYTALGVWALILEQPTSIALLDVLHARIEGPDLPKAMLRLQEQWGVAAFFVESVGMQLSIIQTAIREGVRGRELKRGKEDKYARAYAATPWYAAGRVWLRQGAPTTDEFIAEMLDFPKGDHDDYVDMGSDAVLVAERDIGSVMDMGVEDEEERKRDRSSYEDRERKFRGFSPAKPDSSKEDDLDEEEPDRLTDEGEDD